MTTQAQARPAAEEFRAARQVHDRERILTWLESAERARALSIVVTKGKQSADAGVVHSEESKTEISNQYSVEQVLRLMTDSQITEH